MIDKRKFHYFLNQSKDEHPEYFELIEAVQKEFEDKIESISKEEKKALKQYPIQFVKRIFQEKGEWTSQLHIWAEHNIPEILELDPIFLSFKNSAGDSVLMCFVLGVTGAYTEKINYELIQKILDTDLSYEDIEKIDDGEKIILKNALDEKDLNGKTVLDYLIDFAFAVGMFEGEEPDEKLQSMLREFSKNWKTQKTEEQKILKEQNQEELENEQEYQEEEMVEEAEEQEDIETYAEELSEKK